MRFKNDSLMWILVVLVLIASIVGNYYYAALPWAIKAVAVIIIAAVVLLIASQTTQGQKVWVFAKGARNELRKVVWPSRQETVRTTMVVIGMVLVMSLILWGIDSIFLWAVSWLNA